MDHRVTAVIDANILYPALKDFPAETLTKFDIAAQHPDDFLLSVFDEAPGLFCAAIKRQRESLRNPPKTAEEMLITLESQGLTQVVAHLSSVR